MVALVLSIDHDLGKRLSDLDSLLLSGSSSQGDQGSDKVHSLFHLLVDERFIGFWEVCHVDAFFASQVGIDLVGQERRDRRDQLCRTDQNFVSGRIHALLVFCHFFCVESSSRSSDIPVRQILRHKFRDCSHRLHVVVAVHIASHVFDQLVVLGQNPAVEFRSLVVIYGQLIGFEVVLVGVNDEEIVYVLQGA